MSTTIKRDIRRGYGNEQRPVLGVLWERDAVGQNAAMQAHGNYEPNNLRVGFNRYYDEGYFKRELEKVWQKQWLFACREEDIPSLGDRVPFDVGPHSYFVIRSAPGEFKAFHNSCLHRGTILCAKHQSGTSIRCPYHAWEWHIDGRLSKIPSHWDFTDINKLNGSLLEVKLAQWGGFIFINADPDAPPLEDALGPIPEHFKDFAPETRYTKARFRKLVHANWKATQEAFMEAYHLYATHPEGVPFTGDSQAQYDVFRTPMGAVGREAVPSAVPSMHAPADATEEAAANVLAQIVQQWHYPEVDLPAIDPDANVRAQIAAWMRQAYFQTYGKENKQPDAVMLDSSLYFMYPHFAVWLCEPVPFVYQFLPHASDPNMSYFDVRLLMPYPVGQEQPPSDPPVHVGIDESIQEKAPKFTFLGMVFDQDMDNLPLVQRGMKSADPLQPHSRLGTYQESLIQTWHELYDRDMSA